ncbi:hypothetical protein BS639_10645 [Rouxiella silvae]|uniref:Uncharacterized protein n=1 Tax=Rouxiella silvae TaxID=1646373 RepID=A0ABX3U185_9GAMM|nr:hypothetical protein BS639_10645 [Rouxiella silvae]
MVWQKCSGIRISYLAISVDDNGPAELNSFDQLNNSHRILFGMSAPRSKLPVNMVKLYHSSEVQKITLTYNNFRYPN